MQHWFTLPHDGGSSLACSCATDRIVEVFGHLEADTVISVPVDEPGLDPGQIVRALEAAGAGEPDQATTFFCEFFAEQDYVSVCSAKVVLDARGQLLYMSRAIIPVRKDGSHDATLLKKNVGVFVFPRRFLERLAAQAAVPTQLDRLEGLEQLRWLELGLHVRCLEIRHIGFGVDLPEHLSLLAERLQCASPPTRSA